MPPSVLPLLVRVPDSRNVEITAVYVPPEASVRLPAMFRPVGKAAVTVLVLPVKSTFLK